MKTFREYETKSYEIDTENIGWYLEAQDEHQAILCKMPWRLATKGYRRIKETGVLDDSAKQYVLIGHSQGGKMAAQFVYENPGLIHQLVLLGTTHPRDIDLSASEVPTMKIYGSNDGVVKVEKVESMFKFL